MRMVLGLFLYLTAGSCIGMGMFLTAGARLSVSGMLLTVLGAFLVCVGIGVVAYIEYKIGVSP